MKEYDFHSEIYASEVGKGGAYVIFPFDIRQEFGRGRVRVSVLFESIPYVGSIVNMGVKNDDGDVCYIVGIRKDIRLALEKEIGDIVKIKVKELQENDEP